MTDIVKIIEEVEEENRIKQNPVGFDSLTKTPLFDLPAFGFTKDGEVFWPATFIASGI